ncbi:MAG TPA: PAS domain-containing protein [Hanamia sp.]|nr:PAS domain-containing protein [Hanamia sp.]
MIDSSSLLNIFKTSGLPSLILLPDAPRFTIEAANSALLKNADKKEEDILGKGIFEAFPQNPDDPSANGISNLLASLQKVLNNRKPDKMPVQKYDMLKNNEYEERFWQVENVPVLSTQNEVEYIVHTTVDITDSVLLILKEQEHAGKNDLPAGVSKILINEGSDLVAIVDLEGIYQYLSPSFEIILGYCPNDFIGKNGFDFVHPQDKELIYQEFLQLKEQKRVHASPYRFRHKNGSWRWIETVLTNMMNDAQVQGTVAVSRDISQWMNAEEERKISEEKYKMLFNFSPIPKWVYALDTFEILDVNETALKNYGYSREEFLSMTVTDIRPNEEIKELLKEREKIDERKGVVRFGVFTHLKKDGTRIKVDVSGNRFSFKNRDCMMVVCIDITAKEEALLQLKDNQEKLTAAQNIAKIGYFKVDLKTQKIFWSDKLYEIWGTNKKTFKVTFPNFFRTVHPDDALQFEKVRSEAIRSGTEMDLEFRVVQPDGRLKWLHEKGKIEKNEKGERVSFEGTVQDVTAQKLLKLSLEESNERYYYASKATFDAIYDWDFISDECFWGEGFTRDFGYDSEALSDKMFWESHVHPDDKEKIENEIKSSAEGEATNWLNEYRFRKADGTYAFVLDRSIIIRDRTGKAIRMIGAIQNITEKKTLQQLLDKANRLAKIGSWEIDVESNTVYWSDIVKEIREVPEGYTPSLQDGILHFKEGHSRETIIKRVKDAVKNGTPWAEDLQIYTHKGNLKWMRTIGNAEIVDGKCVKVYGSFQDIDEQKKAELEIRKLYEEKNVILESIGDAFFAVNKSWVVTYWNKEAEKMLMVPKDKIIEQHLWDVFSDSIGSLSYQKYHEAISINQQVFFEDYYPALNKWFEISAYPSENGLSVYFKDTTERKLSQIKLSELHENLKKTANDLALSNAELEQFAYIASHDLQEPLRMVTSFLSQLEKKYYDVIDEKGKQYIYFAVDGAKRMRQIILDLLEFSRVGRFDGKIEPVDSNEVVKEVVSLFRNQIEESGAEIYFKELPVVQAFKGPFRQVIQNLVSNGLKYQKANVKPVIHISASKQESYWRFAVSDNGIGIDPEFFDKIFVIFQRLHNKDEYSGTGIGLAIVKKIVEAFGGRIWVESKPGEGSTFFFTLAE